LISQTWECSRAITPIVLPATMGNTHRYHPGISIRHQFSDTFPDKSPPGLVSVTPLPPRHLRPVTRMMARPSH
jgi:hypothetical protein